MHITYPNQTVTLDTIPEVFLHIKMDRIGAGLPYIIDIIIIAFKAAEISEIPENGNGIDFLNAGCTVFAKEIDPDKPESGISGFDFTKPG